MCSAGRISGDTGRIEDSETKTREFFTEDEDTKPRASLLKSMLFGGTGLAALFGEEPTCERAA